MAEIFATAFPQNINCNLIYDNTKKCYRPATNEDYGGGAAGFSAFGRQRVAIAEGIFSSKQIFDNQPLYWDDIQYSGSGTSSTYAQNRASTTLGVSASTAGKRIRQTFMRFNYQPGKSQIIFLTSVFKRTGGGTGITMSQGVFDDNNGLFLKLSGNTLSVVRRSKVSGSPVDETVTQSNWNIDKMDGTGVSGVNIDVTKSQILVIDFEWLGVGRVRLGFNIDGITYYFHHFLNANVLSSVYMSTPNLPLRFEIENNGAGVASSMECICSSVISENGKEEVGTNRYISTDGIPITATKTYSNALLAIRLKDNYLGCTVDLSSTSLLVTSNDNHEWRLVMNPSGIGSLNFSGMGNSAIEYAICPNETHISGGYALAGGYSQTKTEVALTSDKNLLKLGSSITGRKDVIVLSCRPLGTSNAIFYGGINFTEFS